MLIEFFIAAPLFRICDAAGTRRRGRKRASAAVTAAQVLDELDAELVSGGHSEEISVRRPDFPVDGWTCDTSKLPDNVSLGVILDHLRARGKSVAVKKPFTRGFNFFFWSYVHGVEVCERNNKYFFRAKCWASQCKKDNYALECVLQPTVSTYFMSVLYAHCACPAGVVGSCHHMVALLLSVEHCAKKKQDMPAEQTVSTERQSWGPRQRLVVPQPVSTLVVERASSEGAEALQSVRKASNLYEARSENVRNVSGEDLRKLAVDMEKVSPSAPIHTVLSTAADQHVHLCTSKMGEVPFGCILSYQLLDAEHIEVPGARKRPLQRTAPPSQHATPQQPCNTIQAGTEKITVKHSSATFLCQRVARLMILMQAPFWWPKRLPLSVLQEAKVAALSGIL